MRKLTLALTLLACGIASLALARPGDTDKRALVERYIEDVWNNGNVVDVITEDFVRSGPAGNSTLGIKEFKEYVATVFDGWSNISCTVDDLKIARDHAVLRWTWKGTNTGTFPGIPKATNKPVKVSGTSIYRFDGDRIASEQVAWDFLDEYLQIGLLPPVDDRLRAAELVNRFINELYGEGNLSVAYDIVTSNHVLHVPDRSTADGAGKVRGPEALKDRVAMFRNAFPDLTFTTYDTIFEGDTIVTRWTFSGTHKGLFLGVAPTNNRVTVEGISISRIEDGKIAETWGTWDTGEALYQLGVK